MSVEEIDSVLELSGRLDKVGKIWHIQPTSALSGTFLAVSQLDRSLKFHFMNRRRIVRRARILE